MKCELKGNFSAIIECKATFCGAKVWDIRCMRRAVVLARYNNKNWNPWNSAQYSQVISVCSIVIFGAGSRIFFMHSHTHYALCFLYIISNTHTHIYLNVNNTRNGKQTVLPLSVVFFLLRLCRQEFCIQAPTMDILTFFSLDSCTANGCYEFCFKM